MEPITLQSQKQLYMATLDLHFVKVAGNHDLIAPSMVGKSDLSEVSPPQEDPREQPEIVHHEGGADEPEELAEQLEVGLTIPHQSLGVEDKEGPPAHREEHG